MRREGVELAAVLDLTRGGGHPYWINNHFDFVDFVERAAKVQNKTSSFVARLWSNRPDELLQR
jgi:hypothetical protein